MRNLSLRKTEQWSRVIGISPCDNMLKGYFAQGFHAPLVATAGAGGQT